MGDAGAIPWARLILGGVVGIAVAALIVVLVGPLGWAALRGGSSYRIKDSDMAPGLLPGDWVLAEKLAPGEMPPRGTIVAYEVPGGHGQQAIRRVIGLPGDSVQVRGGALYLNGHRAGMERLEDRILAHRREGWGIPPPVCINQGVTGPCIQEVWRETLPGGTSQRVINGKGTIGLSLPGGSPLRDDTPLHKVPQGMVFLMGDNRDQADDSRMARHGPVPLSSLHYRIYLIHTSLDRSSRFAKPRFDRFFREVE